MRSAAVFLINLSTLLLVFLPKMLLTRSAEIAPVHSTRPAALAAPAAPDTGSADIDVQNWIGQSILADARKRERMAEGDAKRVPSSSSSTSHGPGPDSSVKMASQ